MAAEPDYSDLSAVYVNCTLKRSPEVSNTQGLMDASIRLMREHQIGSLPVVQDGQLIGIVTQADFMDVARDLLEQKLKEG